ncbi:DUF4160 domain-containing protein (plasmid) [Rhizobium rhizogenes]|uniref:DUF4160 domain-containing protein n=1 Tax=Rhizobium rhizogenes TaxID=359 RepID=UPI001572C7B8|nr:DUF4160 domain-containing protein [Rhizobium rhizogenes]NTI26843.1 DUF4160 domain-containing protein [Rhizobium rhizogenes]QTG10182.1 DUF4160 domain-containing protein [Rhizobium rhizogenes]
MILFHHTSVSLAEGILASQLNQGHVMRRSGEPLRDVVWLTTDESHEGHGLTTGEQLDPVHRPYVEKVEQTKLRRGRVGTADKTRIRIKVKIPTRDRKLFNYCAWSRKDDGPKFAKFMGLSCVKTVAGLNASELEKMMSMTVTKEETWFLSFRPIDPEEFDEVLYRTEDGYVPYDFEQHGRRELEAVGIYAAGQNALSELRGLLGSRHRYDRASAVVTCANIAMPANVVVRGGGITVAFNLETLRMLEGGSGQYEEEIIAWIERHLDDLKEAWEKSRTQLISYS